MSTPDDSPAGSDWPAEAALSRATGFARASKDIDWVEKSIPCQVACPAGTDIPGYLEAIAREDFARAYEINLSDNIFPAVLGRVCTRPCEPACRHGWEGLGEPVAICFAKRSADDFMIRKDPVVLKALFPASGKAVAIIGGGASGLALARELARWGHGVTVYDRHDRPGGLMEQGIPEFRLPRDVLRREVEQIRLAGVEFILGVDVGCDVTIQQLRASHDAVVVAAGTAQPFLPELPGMDLVGVQHGLGFLRAVNAGELPEVHGRVVVIGGGFTAVDCARISQRLGASDVRMVYRRSAAEMYITQSELQAFEEEGVRYEFLATPVSFGGENGQVSDVRFIRTSRVFGSDGRAACEPIPGSEFSVPADLVLLGTGQVRDASWLGDEQGEDLFHAGDFANGSESLIDAIGHGKQVARKVDHYLMGCDRFEEGVWIEDVDAPTTGRTREMNQRSRTPMPGLASGKRGLRDEVEIGLGKPGATTEAERCYLCNYKFEIDNDLCIYCDRCLKVMPVDHCIVKASALIFDDQDRITGHMPSSSSRDYNMLYLDSNACTRCGACVEVCPVECITLQKVTRVVRPVERA